MTASERFRYYLIAALAINTPVIEKYINNIANVNTKEF
jgi:hypothetical protein